MAKKSQSYSKDPDATLDYGFDWDDDDDPYLESGETLVDVTWTVPAGITKDSDELGETLTKIWLSGGTAGATYTIGCKVETTDGRIDERSFDVIVENR